MKIFASLILCILVSISSSYCSAQDIFSSLKSQTVEDYFLDLITVSDEKTHTVAINNINKNWTVSSEIIALETLYFLPHGLAKYQLLKILEKKTGQQLGFDYNGWYNYIWSKDPTYKQNYFDFKAELHKRIDPKFEKYFKERTLQTTIRLDEVRWGGVPQDGIPPLHNPKMITAQEASYLDYDNIVFGIEINGDLRAYPKRILAWHEMFTDTVGEIDVTGVYCTLCGTVILYKSTSNGVKYELGTSGFLYRSNKLMYDKKTQSLWSTLQGKPVIGPLTEKEVQLEYLSVITTTWGEWKKRHPETTVLSLNTGYERDYDEGIAYQDYFETDDLMFNTPKRDKRLKNKQEILALRLPENTDSTMAISSKYLKKHDMYTNAIGNKKFIVFTDTSGAHRVFLSEDVAFKSYDRGSSAIDSENNIWLIKENSLVQQNSGRVLKRLHSFNAFWFGFSAAYPNTILIK